MEDYKTWCLEANEEAGQQRAMKQICNMARGCTSSCCHKAIHPYPAHPAQCVEV